MGPLPASTPTAGGFAGESGQQRAGQDEGAFVQLAVGEVDAVARRRGRSGASARPRANRPDSVPSMVGSTVVARQLAVLCSMPRTVSHSTPAVRKVSMVSALSRKRTW
ncbi:hypothetical protein GCM10017687_00980 [Streptomyces echinatus]